MTLVSWYPSSFARMLWAVSGPFRTMSHCRHSYSNSMDLLQAMLLPLRCLAMNPSFCCSS